MEQQDAGLRCDGYTNLVGDLQPAAAFEAFLRQEDEDVPLQFLPIGLWQTPADGNVPLDNGLPLGRKRLARRPGPSSLLESQHVVLLNSIAFAGSYIICDRRNEASRRIGPPGMCST